MSKFINIVKVKVKSSHKDEYLKLMNARPAFDGQVSSYVAETASSQFHMVATWHSKEAIAKARPQMIAFLYTFRHTLEELSSELGVTDPSSGPIVLEK